MDRETILACEAARQEGYRMGLEDAANLARASAANVCASRPEQGPGTKALISVVAAGIADVLDAVAEGSRKIERFRS